MPEAIKRIVREYQTSNGRSPFREWLLSLRDYRAQAIITRAIVNMENGNFGDHKALSNANGLQERRLDYGPGYRLYYVVEGDAVIILFSGSDKSDQKQVIKIANEYLLDYQSRKQLR